MEKKNEVQSTGMDRETKRNLIIMLIAMVIMIGGGFVWGEYKKASRVLERLDKVTYVIEEVAPTPDEAKANIELGKQKIKEESSNAKVAIEETRQKFNGALDSIKAKGFTIKVPGENDTDISQN